jgi:hypothetical protein
MSDSAATFEPETLSRFLLQRNHIRADLTIRPDPFIPHPYPRLSVTRREALTETDLWTRGRHIAELAGKNLYGRADLNPSRIPQDLSMESTPTSENPQHVDIIGWPKDKPSQKLLAIEIARIAGKAKLPPG